jgi:hypothetical protein
MSTLADAFVATIRPARSPARDPRPVVENADFIAMLWRMIRALEARAIEDPQLLTQVIALTQRLSEVVNVTIAANADRYAIDPRRGASMAECARVLGISKQSASERRARGVAIMGDRIDRAGAVRFAEAQRERAAITAAAEHAVTNLAEFRARHAA